MSENVQSLIIYRWQLNKSVDFFSACGIIIARTSYMYPHASEWGTFKINKEKLNDLR